MHAWITSGSPHLGPVLHVSYPSVEWLDRLATAPSKMIDRVVGDYHLFAVGVRLEREGAVHYWGSVNAVPRNRFSTDRKAAIFDFDQELFETADAAANHAIERVISIIPPGDSCNGARYQENDRRIGTRDRGSAAS